MFIAVKRDRAAMAGQVAAGGAEVTEGRFRRGEKQLPQLPGGVIDVDQQIAGRGALFKPGERRAVQLH